MKQTFVENLLQAFGTTQKVIETLKLPAEAGNIEASLDLQVFLNAVGREEESFEVSQSMLKNFPDDSRVLFNHGWHLLKRGYLSRGLAYLEFGRELKTYGMPEPFPSRMPLWNFENGRGQRVILVLEGGLGDEIIHFRFGRDLAERHNCKVGVICQPGLAPIFARQPWVSFVAQREAGPGILHDSWLPGMSAALALGHEYQDISGRPYLTASAEYLEKWRQIIKPAKGKLKVGIRWSGNPKFEHQQLRKFDPQLLISLAELPDLQLYSFQRDEDLQPLPENVVDLNLHLKDWDDTAAALSQMDLVISSCTSVAHLSGALGLRTWVIVPALPYFIWALPGAKSPWYDSATVFRQTHYGAWDNVAKELRCELAKLRPN